MSKNINKAAGSGLSFSSVLFLVFLVLKLTKVINWSWVWVCAPLWVPLSICLLILIIFIIAVIVRDDS